MAEATLESDDQRGDAAAARRAIYEFLASCFTRPPTQRQIDAVRSGEIQNLCAELHGEALCGVPPALPHDLEPQSTICQEFMDLFKVPGGKYLAPYESVYRDTREIEGRPVRGLLMGQSAIDVQKWYRLAAVELSDDCKELPDHIGLEFGYLAHLARKEQEFASVGDDVRFARAREMQRDFLAAHVAAWLGALREKLYEKSDSVYFRAVSDLAVEFVRRDLAALEELVGPSGRHSASG